MNYFDPMPRFKTCFLDCLAPRPEARNPFTVFVPSHESRASIILTRNAPRSQSVETRFFPRVPYSILKIHDQILGVNVSLESSPLFFSSEVLGVESFPGAFMLKVQRAVGENSTTIRKDSTFTASSETLGLYFLDLTCLSVYKSAACPQKT